MAYVRQYWGKDAKYRTPGDGLNHIEEGIVAGLQIVGSSAVPISNAATARPAGAGAVYWMCAAGVTPANALAGDLIWNKT